MPELALPTYRPMIETDLGVAMYIGHEAMEWLRRSQGHTESVPWTPSRPWAQRHLLGTDPEGAWVAEINGVPVGYSMAFVREDIWFLSQLFVQPDHHGHGIGEELLRRAREYGRRRGARRYAVIASGSLVAHALYTRAGMNAVAIGYRMAGPLEPLLALPEVDAGTQRVADCGSWQDQIAELDRAVFGTDRRQDHALYLSSEETPGPKASFALTEEGRLLGYAYAVAGGGFIAPMAAYEPADQLLLLRMAAAWLLDHEVSTSSMMVISHNATLMGALLRAGWHSQGWTFLMQSAPFAQFDRYHPAGGTML